MQKYDQYSPAISLAVNALATLVMVFGLFILNGMKDDISAETIDRKTTEKELRNSIDEHKETHPSKQLGQDLTAVTVRASHNKQKIDELQRLYYADIREIRDRLRAMETRSD